jgi:outer membrane protein assembly factor BamA
MRVWLRCAAAALALVPFCTGAEGNVAREIVSVEVAGSRAPFELETRAGHTMDSAKLREDVKRLWASGRFEDVRVESTMEDGGVRLVFRLTEKPTLRLRHVVLEPNSAGLDAGIEPDARVDSWRAQSAAAAIRSQLVAQGYPAARAEGEIVPVDSGRADVRITIDKGEHVRVRDVAFTGELGARPGELRKALQNTKSRTILPGIWRLRPGYSEDAVEADSANLKSLLYRKGFFDARVGLDALEREGRNAHLRFRIDSGPEYAIRTLNIHSPGGSLRPIRPGPGGQFPAKDVCRALFEERRKAEKAGVIEFGARLEISELQDVAAAPGRPKRADIAARVELGPAYRIGRIEFRGNRAFSDMALRRAMLLDEGQPVDQMLLRKTLARLNRTGLFEPLSPANVVLNTAPGAEVADLTIHVREKKRGHWALSGPVGPLSIAGPLQFAIGSRLPSWGRGIFELSTYTASISFMTFAQPIASLLPFLPNKRFLVLGMLHRPMLPGQRFTSGFAIAPQLGWQGMALGYGMGQVRDLLSGPLQGERELTPPLEVKITRGVGPDAPIVGIMLCEMPATKLDRLRQVGSVGLNLVFAMSPF